MGAFLPPAKTVRKFPLTKGLTLGVFFCLPMSQTIKRHLRSLKTKMKWFANLDTVPPFFRDVGSNIAFFQCPFFENRHLRQFTIYCLLAARADPHICQRARIRGHC